MKRGTWRDICRPVVHEVLSQKLPKDEERKALYEAYPFGPRERWPYKVWLDEIRRQKGTRKTITQPANQIEIEF